MRYWRPGCGGHDALGALKVTQAAHGQKDAATMSLPRSTTARPSNSIRGIIASPRNPTVQPFGRAATSVGVLTDLIVDIKGVRLIELATLYGLVNECLIRSKSRRVRDRIPQGACLRLFVWISRSTSRQAMAGKFRRASLGEIWRRRADSNRRIEVLQTSALATWLRRRNWSR